MSFLFCQGCAASVSKGCLPAKGLKSLGSPGNELCLGSKTKYFSWKSHSYTSRWPSCKGTILGKYGILLLRSKHMPQAPREKGEFAGHVWNHTGQLWTILRFSGCSQGSRPKRPSPVFLPWSLPEVRVCGMIGTLEQRPTPINPGHLNWKEGVRVISQLGFPSRASLGDVDPDFQKRGYSSTQQNKAHKMGVSKPHPPPRKKNGKVNAMICRGLLTRRAEAGVSIQQRRAESFRALHRSRRHGG